MMFRTLSAACLTLLLIAQSQASVPLGGNRKGVGGSYDLYGCMHSNDYYVVNFAAYQLAPDQAQNGKSLPEAECTDIPTTGNTQISIDLLDLDVRKKPVGLKILGEDGTTIADVPMAVFKQGVLSVTANLKTAGNYQAVLSVDDTDLRLPLQTTALHIPLTVAVVTEQSGGKKGLTLVFVSLGILIAVLAYGLPRLLKPASVNG